jgi:sugar phosphate isomerase/epimerase
MAPAPRSPASLPRIAASLRPQEVRSDRSEAMRAAGVEVELDLSHPPSGWLPSGSAAALAAPVGEERESHRLVPVSTHAPHVGLDPLSPDPFLARYARASLRRAVRDTAALGADRMVLHSGLPFRRDVGETLTYLERLAPWLSSLASEAADVGVTLLLENTTERDPACLRPLFEALPSVGFCFDPAHALAFADVVDPDAWRIVLGPWLRHLHLSGTEPGVDRHRPLAGGVGTSVDDLAVWASALPTDAWVVLETVPFLAEDAAHVRRAWSRAAAGPGRGLPPPTPVGRDSWRQADRAAPQ